MNIQLEGGEVGMTFEFDPPYGERGVDFFVHFLVLPSLLIIMNTKHVHILLYFVGVPLCQVGTTVSSSLIMSMQPNIFYES